MDLNSESIKVVAHTADGILVKGSTQDFHQDRAVFRIVLPNGVDTVPMEMSELKAVFFVRQLAPASPRPRQKEFSPNDGNRGNGRPVAVQFQDGELLLGYALTYSPNRQGFFMLPPDPDDNNLRIFVVKRAVKVVHLGPAAVEFTHAASHSSEATTA